MVARSSKKNCPRPLPSPRQKTTKQKHRWLPKKQNKTDGFFPTPPPPPFQGRLIAAFQRRASGRRRCSGRGARGAAALGAGALVAAPGAEVFGAAPGSRDRLGGGGVGWEGLVGRGWLGGKEVEGVGLGLEGLVGGGWQGSWLGLVAVVFFKDASVLGGWFSRAAKRKPFFFGGGRSDSLAFWVADRRPASRKTDGRQTSGSRLHSAAVGCWLQSMYVEHHGTQRPAVSSG